MCYTAQCMKVTNQFSGPWICLCGGNCSAWGDDKNKAAFKLDRLAQSMTIIQLCVFKHFRLDQKCPKKCKNADLFLVINKYSYYN